MLDALFSCDRGTLSLRECYIELTGDRDVTGEYSRCDPARMREGFGESFVEALATASWAVTLGGAVERRVHAAMDEMAELQAWRKIARVVPVKSFHPQHGMRIGGYGNLPTVAKGGDYQALGSPGEEGGSYSVAKRGGVESITLEMIANDDVAAVRRVPAELALAAANTLYEFVFDFIRTNPVIYDGLALFHATHGNLGTSALDAASYFAAATAIAKQTRLGSGKRVGFGRKTLLVPLELQHTAYTAFVQGQTEAAVASGLVPDVVAVPYWTDANDWAVVNDPSYCPTIEVGFLGGRELPEIVVSEDQKSDSFFSQDKITYKVRHVYGGAPVDFCGAYKSVVV
jgi:hypothetical protein